MSSTELRIVDEVGIDTSLDQRIRAFLVGCFPRDATEFTKTRGWHGSMPVYSVLLESDGTLVAHVSVVERTISVGDKPLRIAGVQNVAVAPEWRGKRLVDRVMIAAMSEARRRGFDTGMLFCVASLCPVYARTGWQPLGRRTILKSAAGRDESPLQTDDAAMFYPLRRGDFPAGVIQLKGNDW